MNGSVVISGMKCNCTAQLYLSYEGSVTGSGSGAETSLKVKMTVRLYISVPDP
jgi:hypothetical protein